MNDLNEIRDFAWSQFNNEDLESEIGFDYDNQWIINPWIDSTGRFELTDEQAIEEYGQENFDLFINLAQSYLNNNSI